MVALAGGTLVLLVAQGWLGVIARHSSLDELGQYGGERRDLAIQTLERHRADLSAAARLVDLDPRTLAVAIFAERYFCYAPYFEPLVDWFAGNSVGWTQVTTYSLRGALRALFHPTRFDRYLYDRDHPALVRAWRKHFRRYDSLTNAQLKWALLIDPRFNAEAAALVLKQKLMHYAKLPGGFVADDRPEIVATLYHTGLPAKPAGRPDENGIQAGLLYRDPAFLADQRAASGR